MALNYPNVPRAERKCGRNDLEKVTGILLRRESERFFLSKGNTLVGKKWFYE